MSDTNKGKAEKAAQRTLREWRKRKGWVQVDLAAMVQISNSSVSQIELGNQIPRIDIAQRIAHALGLATDDIAWGKYASDALNKDDLPREQPKRIRARRAARVHDKGHTLATR